jgi:hypothetical protein
MICWHQTIKSGWDQAEWLECLAINAKVATVLGSIPASSDAAESEGRQIKQWWITDIKNKIQKNDIFSKDFLLRDGDFWKAYQIKSLFWLCMKKPNK